MQCYNVCPNCGQYMYEHRCRAICPRCNLFFDCEDLFHYDEVVMASGERQTLEITGQVSYTPRNEDPTDATA
ncbi:MAG TPA: hypothetical protein ENO21_04540 [Firmicutes bacterium]|nr:hypothetical protein [Bacillota bacterium]